MTTATAPVERCWICSQIADPCYRDWNWPQSWCEPCWHRARFYFAVAAMRRFLVFVQLEAEAIIDLCHSAGYVDATDAYRDPHSVEYGREIRASVLIDAIVDRRLRLAWSGDDC